MKWNNKKGSYTIFITMIFSSLILLSIVMIKASGQVAISSTADDFVNLWGKSILAEYDRELKDRYGLFGFNGNITEVEDKLAFYANHTYKKKEYIEYSIKDCSLEGFRLESAENFKKQLKEIAVMGIRPKVNKEKAEENRETRYISNKWIIDGLPSKGRERGIGVTALIKKIKEGASLEGIVSGVSENLYIFVFYKDYMNDRDLGETYFENEIEYIISGNLDEEKARKSVYRNLLFLRNGLNIAYLYSSMEKRQAALMAAEAITPGPEAVITQAIILETWAFLEAVNDLELLYDNKPVPMIKTDSSWALSIENALDEGIAGDGEDSPINEKEKKSKKYVEPKRIEGIDYDDYLRILITALPESTRLLRMADIIQINMKFIYCDYFLISDYYTGLKYSLYLNGKEHKCEKEY